MDLKRVQLLNGYRQGHCAQAPLPRYVAITSINQEPLRDIQFIGGDVEPACYLRAGRAFDLNRPKTLIRQFED